MSVTQRLKQKEHIKSADDVTAAGDCSSEFTKMPCRKEIKISLDGQPHFLSCLWPSFSGGEERMPHLEKNSGLMDPVHSSPVHYFGLALHAGSFKHVYMCMHKFRTIHACTVSMSVPTIYGSVDNAEKGMVQCFCIMKYLQKMRRHWGLYLLLFMGFNLLLFWERKVLISWVCLMECICCYRYFS